MAAIKTSALYVIRIIFISFINMIFAQLGLMLSSRALGVILAIKPLTLIGVVIPRKSLFRPAFIHIVSGVFRIPQTRGAIIAGGWRASAYNTKFYFFHSATPFTLLQIRLAVAATDTISA